jgi:hypothetical protein
MGLGPFVVAALTSDPTVNQLIGNAVFDTAPPQQTNPPFVVFEEFDGERFHQMGSDANICNARLRLHIWHNTARERDALVDACRRVLQRYSGLLANTQVDDVLIEPGGPNFYDDMLRAFHGVRDFRVFYRESGPAES